MKKQKIPKETIKRLPLYYRCLNRLIVLGNHTLSSTKLSEHLGIKPTQIRKDLSYFGDFGTRGVDYDLSKLVNEIESILNLDRNWNIAIAGVSNIGCTIMDLLDFDLSGFNLVAAFDSHPDVIGNTVYGIEIKDINDLEDYNLEAPIDIGIISVQATNAGEIADCLVDRGVKGIINFAPTLLNLPKGVEVVQMDLTSELGWLVFYLGNQ